MCPLASVIDDVDDYLVASHAEPECGWAINNAPSNLEKGRQTRQRAGPDGVVAYHAALSRLRPGFKSRSGRHSVSLLEGLFAAIFGRLKESDLPLLPRFGFERIDAHRNISPKRENRIIVGVNLIEGECMC